MCKLGWSCAGFTALLVLSSAPPLRAQWVRYPTAGMPRKADGTPNLAAPAPKKDGKPDLSGIWAAEKNRPCPPAGCDDMEIGQEFLNIGWSLKGGLPYQPWAADLVKTRTARHGQDDPGSHCLPTGIVMMHTTPLLKKIVQLPGLIAILNERNTAYRQIFTDGRPLENDPQPTWNGYSTGKWVGNTLVVESNGFREGVWLDRGGSPLTEAGKITERFRRVNFGRMEIELTVNDPKAYRSSWTIKLNQNLVPDTELLDYVCLENEKDMQHLTGK